MKMSSSSSSPFFFEQEVASNELKFGDAVSIRLHVGSRHQQLVNIDGVLLTDGAGVFYVQCDVQHQKNENISFKIASSSSSTKSSPYYYYYLDKISKAASFVPATVADKKNNNNRADVTASSRGGGVFDVTQGVTMELIPKKKINTLVGNKQQQQTTSTANTISIEPHHHTRKHEKGQNAQSNKHASSSSTLKVALLVTSLISIILFLLVSNYSDFLKSSITMLSSSLSSSLSTSDATTNDKVMPSSSSSNTMINSGISSSSSSSIKEGHFARNFNYPNPPFTKLPIPDNNNNNNDWSRSVPFSSTCFPLTHMKEDATSCPDEDLYLAMWLLVRNWNRPENKDRALTLVDVGSNKGYTVAAFLEAMNLTTMNEYYYTKDDIEDIEYDLMMKRKANASMSSKLFLPRPPLFSRRSLAFDIYDVAESTDVLTPGWRHALFGACCDGAETSPFDPKDSPIANHKWIKQRTGDVYVPKADIFLFDGTQAHTEYTKTFFEGQLKKYNRQYDLAAAKSAAEKKQILSQKTDITFHINRAAVSNHTGVTKFCTDTLGLEFGKMCPTGIETPVVTLDSFPELQKFDKIDFLVIDTEGHDFGVFRHEGMRERFLKPGKVGIMIFELHRGPDKTPLNETVKELQDYGYTCYFPVHGRGLKRHVARLTPMSEDGCWTDAYVETARGWRNMMCAQLDTFPELRFVFNELAILPKDHQFEWCHIRQVKKKFFDHVPERNWTWQEEQIRIEEKLAKEKVQRDASSTTAAPSTKPPSTAVTGNR